MCRVDKLAMNILQSMQRQLLVLFDPMGMQHMLVEYLGIDTSHVGMVRNAHHRPIVARMHIHRDIHRVMLLLPIVLFVPSHKVSMQMNLHPVDRIRDRMIDTNHCQYRGIYLVDNVLCEKKSEKIEIERDFFQVCVTFLQSLTFTISR